MRIGKDGDNDLVKVVSNGTKWWNYYRGFNAKTNEYTSVKEFGDMTTALRYANEFNEHYYIAQHKATGE